MCRLSERILEHGAFLQRRRPFWAPNPYRGEDLPWTREHPALTRALLALDLEQVERGEADSASLDLPEPYPTLRAEARRHGRLPQLPGVPEARNPHHRYIKGRKLEQIEAFAAAVMAWWAPGVETELLDWCSGHGHLGRHLARRTGCAVTCVEHDPQLVAAARALGGVRAVQADALAEGTRELRPGRAAVALHACGDLGAQLVLHGQHLEAIALAPCCYVRTTAGWNRRLSRAAPDLQLERKHVVLSTVGEFTANGRRKRLRRREQAWRLALDSLLREHTGRDEFHSVPSCRRKTLTNMDFAAWARVQAERAGHELPGFDPAQAEATGWARARHVRALGLVRALYPRSLEIYLALDRAVALEEQGREVQLGLFCASEVTPRNLLILAR